MDSSQTHIEMERQLVACVQESLAMYLYSNACFMCERLCAEFPHSEVSSKLESEVTLSCSGPTWRFVKDNVIEISCCQW